MPIKKHFDSRCSLRALAAGSLFAAGAFVAAPAEAQNTCTVVSLATINCTAPLPTTPPTTGSINLTGSPNPIVVNLADGFVSNGPMTLGTVGGADINVISNGVSTIQSTGPGLVANSSGAVNAQITNVSTVGDGATGVLLNAADNAIFTSGGTIQTAGANAPGVDITGRSVTANVNLVQTQGPSSNGVQLFSTNGPTTLNFNTIQTNGDLSNATVLRGTGNVNLSGHLLSTNGGNAAGFNISTDPAACILLGNGGCSVTSTVDQVTTNGFGGVGGLVSGNGPTNVTIGALQTNGNQAAGLDLSSNPATCVALGVGSCGTAFTVGKLTTAGNDSPGAVVRAVGNTNANVGVLSTSGDRAAGLNLGSDPTACAVLGAGACDTSFSVGQLTTSGAGSTGALVRSAGKTNGSVDTLATGGNNSPGIDIAGDPTACVLLGAGGCDVGLSANQVSTKGNGAGAVLINTVGNVTTRLGALSTGGSGSPGLGIVTDPTLCAAVGPGSCTVNAAARDVRTAGVNSPGIAVTGGSDPVNVDAGTVATGGANSPGVEVNASGPINIAADTVTTAGDASPGILVNGGAGPIRASFRMIRTAGAASPGVAITGTGAINVLGGDVATTGPGSDGVVVAGGAGPVTVDVGAVTTAGPDSNGIDVATTTGAQTILAGPVRVNGLRAAGIRANATGCANVSVTARDDVVSGQGAAISASSACAVAVTTLPGAAVSGATAGIAVNSGTGSTIVVGDSVASGAGPAIDAKGAPTAIAIQATGSVAGAVDLTPGNDTLDNAGTFAAAGTSNFGAGADLLTNRGTIRLARNAQFGGLETLANQGLVTLVDGAADDTLTTSGNFAGGAGSAVALDVAAGVAGTPADQLVIGGAATGTTAISLNLLGGAGVANPTGTVIVTAASQTPNAFTLAGPTRAGFVDFSLRTNGGQTRLVALPNALALEPLLLGQAALDFWYQSADAWKDQAMQRRGDLAAGMVRKSGMWVEGYVGSERRGQVRSVDVFGTPQSTDLRRETERLGAQAGFGFRSGASTLIGVTGGWQRADAKFASGTHAVANGFNLGAYLIHAAPAGVHYSLLGKVDRFGIRFRNGALFGGTRFNGTSYGAEGEIGYRFGSVRFPIDLDAGLAYVRSDLDSFSAGGGQFAYGTTESLRGRIGARIGGGGIGWSPYGDVRVLHEFLNGGEARFVSGGFTLPLADRGTGTWVRGELGLAGHAGATGGFLAAWAEAGDVRGWGLRAGLRW